jgi:hypothetical protein
MDAVTGIAGSPTLFRSDPVGPTHVGAGVHAAMATRLGPTIHPDDAPQFGAASTRVAPAAAPLAYSMTGNIAALTEYVHQYESGPTDWHQAQGPHDFSPDTSDPDPHASHEQALDRPAKKSLLLVGGLAAAFIGIGVAILTTAVVITVTPAADQKPVTTQQPVPTPLATRVSEPPVIAPAPVQPAPAPPVAPPPPAVAPAPQPRVIPRQAPPRATQATHRATPTPTPSPSPSDQERAPGDVPQHPSHNPSDVPPADDGSGLPPDEHDVPPHRGDPPLDEGNGPPPRSHNPFSPHVGELPAGDGGGEPRRGGGGLLGGAGCIPLLPC